MKNKLFEDWLNSKFRLQFFIGSKYVSLYIWGTTNFRSQLGEWVAETKDIKKSLINKFKLKGYENLELMLNSNNEVIDYVATKKLTEQEVKLLGLDGVEFLHNRNVEWRKKNWVLTQKPSGLQWKNTETSEYVFDSLPTIKSKKQKLKFNEKDIDELLNAIFQHENMFDSND